MRLDERLISYGLTIYYISIIFGICLLGAASALLGFKRLDKWCFQQLDDV